MENSIYHGIERKIGKGHLVIRIGVSDERMRIRISDDGLGMSEDKLRALNERLRSLSLEDVEESGGASRMPESVSGPAGQNPASGSASGPAGQNPASQSVSPTGSRPARKGGIAIVNVNNRIKLLFGEEYGISVYSHEGAGTDVLISLPLRRV